MLKEQVKFTHTFRLLLIIYYLSAKKLHFDILVFLGKKNSATDVTVNHKALVSLVTEITGTQ